MRHLNRLASVFCTAALGLLALTGCEGGDLYNLDSPDWISEKIDSISKTKDSGEEELEGMMEDVYTFGNTDYTSGFWSAFSKYYVIPENTKWNAVFNLSINPDDNTYYKNFALIVTNDVDRSGTGYTEYGAYRFDATNDTATYNSQWGSYLYFKYTESTQLMSPVDNIDAGLQKLGGKVTLTVDRSVADTFRIKITNGTVTKTYTQPFALPNINADASNTNIRCFLVPEGSYINFLQTNIEPIGGCTSADDKQPISMELQNVPDEVDLGTPLDTAMQNVSAVVTFEEGVTQTVSAADLYFSAIPDMDEPGEKNLVVIYNKTFKGENCDKPIVANAKFNVVTRITDIHITAQPSRTTYYYYTSAATSELDGRTLAFDPTGMEVTATYANGDVAVVNNDKLTFSAVPAIEGTHEVTVSTANGCTATTEVSVAESPVSSPAVNPTTLGATDCSTGWWSAFIDDIKVPAGETYRFDFTNYAGSSNWNNFVVILRQQDLTEYAVLRADNYGWSGIAGSYETATNSGGQADWATWLAAMNGAKVTLYVTNCNNGCADVQAVMRGTDGNTYIQYYLGVSNIVPDNLYTSFTVDSSCLVFDNAAGAKAKKAKRARR